VDVLPTPNQTKPSAVFFDCGNDFECPAGPESKCVLGGKWHYNCHPGASIVTQNFTLEGWLMNRIP